MMISGFILAHFCLLLILLGVVFPRYYDIFIPSHRRAEGTEATIANEPKEQGFVPETGVLDHESGMPAPSSKDSSERMPADLSVAPKI